MTTAVRKGARPVDLVWLTWRQHRWLLVVTAVAIGGFVVCCQLAQPSGQGVRVAPDWIAFLNTLAPVYAGLVAVFWGAPLLAREYEQRTHLLVWGLDVSPVRWLFSKTVLLAAVAAVLAVVLGMAGTAIASEGPFSVVGFEYWPPIQVVYVVFGLALGTTVSVMVRRTVLSMVATLVGFTAVRVLIAKLARPVYLPPVRSIAPLADWPRIEPFALVVDQGNLDAAGNLVPQDMLIQCALGGGTSLSGDAMSACQKKLGVTQTFSDYQPVERLLDFHLIETAIFLVLSAGLLLLAWRLVRRQGAL
ncbi:MAG: hypothetical protein JOZ47_18775 [Kutzneria sp.]|nr:hypothetical protein [Kutzneria sp.]MBV9847088.1 hypothetical protein [Kutzneria sp.]